MKDKNKLGILMFAVALCAQIPCSARSENTPVGPPADKADVASTSSTVTLTLKECLKRALANSEKLKAERHRLTMFEEQQDQIWWLPFSNFSISGAFTVVQDNCAAYDPQAGTLKACNDGTHLPSISEWRNREWGPSFHASFNGAIPIPSSGKLWQGKRALDSARAAKVAQLATFSEQIKFDVHRAYYALIGAREMQYTLKEGRKHLKKAMDKVSENLANQTGSDTEIDLVKLKVFDAKLDAMEQQVIQIEKTALAGLNFLVGAEENRRADIADTPQEPLDIQLKDLEDYKKNAVAHRPEFEALRQGIKALENKLKIQKSEFAPDFALTFSFRKGYTPGVKIEGNGGETPFILNNGYNYGSVVPGIFLVGKLPLDFGVTIHKIREAKAELAAVLADRKYAMEGILLEVETSYIDVTTLHEAIGALARSKRLAKGWLNAAAQNQAVGVGSSNDLKDALKEYFGIMAEYHQKVSEYNIAVAKLDQAVGGAPSLSDVK